MGVWHTYSTRQTLSELETDKSRGLSGAEAERRLARWGPNRLEEGRRQGLLLRFLGQMKDPMILVLLAAAAPVPVGQRRRGLAGCGHHPGHRGGERLYLHLPGGQRREGPGGPAEDVGPLAKVVRDGALQRLETDRLVPGDIIHLEAGTWCPPTPGFWRPPPSRPMRAP